MGFGGRTFSDNVLVSGFKGAGRFPGLPQRLAWIAQRNDDWSWIANVYLVLYARTTHFYRVKACKVVARGIRQTPRASPTLSLLEIGPDDTRSIRLRADQPLSIGGQANSQTKATAKADGTVELRVLGGMSQLASTTSRYGMSRAPAQATLLNYLVAHSLFNGSRQNPCQRPSSITRKPSASVSTRKSAALP